MRKKSDRAARRCGWVALAIALTGTGGVASAAPATDDPTFRIVPLLDARLRYEDVEQGALSAEAVTLRARVGAEARAERLSLLVEGEATVAPLHSYNAFPFPLAGSDQSRPGRAVVADPENLELNRLQLRYGSDRASVTLGRQRINLDDQRWVGSVGWRQNEQSFDAVRGEIRLKRVGIDVAYANSQRSVFGSDGGPRTANSGEFVLAGLAASHGGVQGKLFAYLLDYDEPFFRANSSQTYGGILGATLPLRSIALALRASYARQSDYASNPFDFAADYMAVEAGTTLAGFGLAAGWEKLGSDSGRAVQTPMATLHKFNGWADLFLATPATGLEDAYVTISAKVDGVRQLPGLNASLTLHRFDSDVGDVDFGTEWDASIGFRAGPIGLLLKYANYAAREFGSDTSKLWLQADWGF